MIGVGLVGFGYWGPNLARNFSALSECRLVGVCEIDSKKAERARKLYPNTRISSNYSDILNDQDIHLIAIATPVSSHFDLARQALMAEKNVLVEKPLTRTTEEAEELVRLSQERDLVLAVDHTFLYTGAVRKIKELVTQKELGDIHYIDSVRINLGLLQPDVNVIYDLAPHDISIVHHLLDEKPISVQAIGSRIKGWDYETAAYIHMEYPSGAFVHLHLNWVSPVKIRRTIISGNAKMIVYDDLEQTEKIRIYNSGIDLRQADEEEAYRLIVDYRTGDMMAPKLIHREALAVEAQHLITCIHEHKKPISDGVLGLEVVRIINACQRSLSNSGAKICF